VFDVRYDPASSSATWTSVDADLPDTPITDVAYDDYTGDLYASTDYTVLRRPNGAAAWEQAGGGFPLASTPGLTLRTDGRVLYAATYGRAAWKLALGPGARITGPDTVEVGRTAVYDGSASVAYNNAPLTYEWTLPDGSHATGSTVSYKATGGPGTRTLTLKVTAPDGRSATTTKTITFTTPAASGSGSHGHGFAFMKLVRSSVRLSKKRVYRVALSCPADNDLGCAGTLRVQLKIERKRRTLNTAVVAIPQGKSHTVRLRLSKALRRKLRGRTRVSTRFTIRQIAPDGTIKTKVQRLRIVLRR
jgi:hypothetical protein